MRMKCAPWVTVSLIGILSLLSDVGLGLTIPASEDSTTGSGGKLTVSSNSAPTLLVSSSSQGFVYFSLEDLPEDAVIRFARLRTPNKTPEIGSVLVYAPS